ncbi:zinc finger FYVE domain-containing protein 9 [Biomphalaria glabrata]|nr:zinc finger FYVE domain-containing protein 9 [Biomphalaria glabrata]
MLTSAAPGVNPRSPNPNNPNEYCSKVPPNQQASNHASPPVVMVPTGVLKPSGSHRRSGEPKQVMFSDGIRPGGDLTELDGPEQTRPRRSARGSRKQGPSQHQGSPPARKIKDDSLYRSPCLLPETGLPPIYMVTGDTGYVEHDESINQIDYTDDFKAEGGPFIYFAVNKNLSVGVKIVNLDCCVNRVCWFFVTRGMCTAGQSELIVLLELTEEEMNGSVSPPRDIFVHFHNVYEEALKGFTVQDMGHSICHSNFLGSRDHGGFLYLRPTFQCLSKLSLPEPPYLFGILLQKWEVPWAKVFPIRLMLRLGAEYRYYPCPLVGVRNRKPVFFEIGHTIINLLADFRNYQYMLSHIPGVTIKMEDKKTVINFPRNRYNEVMKVVRNSNEHVMALGSSFSSEADSHLVCIQNEDGSYQTQAINIQNKPRLETGASFVVFNGALKTSTGLRAKSSIVEDGLMVQVLPEAIVSIKEAMKEMTNYTIQCGPLESTSAEEIVELRWTENDKNFNFGVKSYIDGMSLEGVESVSVKSQSDFLGETLAIRWTRVYFLQHQESSSSHFDPLDLSRLTEDIAQACCTALVKHLDELKKEGQVKLGLRVNLTRDSVGYEIGSKGRSLPAAMINNLDTFLVPIVHQASEEGIVMELVFNIVD